MGKRAPGCSGLVIAVIISPPQIDSTGDKTWSALQALTQVGAVLDNKKCLDIINYMNCCFNNVERYVSVSTI